MKLVAAALMAVFLLFAPGTVPAQNNAGPPPLPPAQVQYWYGQGQQRLGPFTPDQMKALIHEGRVKKTTLVWRNGMPNWTPAGDVNDLAVFFVVPDGPPELPNDNWAEFMLGTWYHESTVNNMLVQTYGVYNSDGTVVITANYFGDDLLNPGRKQLITSAQMEGTWKTKAMKGDKFQLIIAFVKASDPAIKLPTTPSIDTLQKTGPNSVYNVVGKFEARRIQ